MERKTPGFTLIEILIVLAICSILLLQAAPSLNDLVTRNRTRADINRIVGAMHLTRHSAVNFGIAATLCHLRSDNRCGGSWASDITVFLDGNLNARLDDQDKVVAVVKPLETQNTVKWRAFQNKPYLQMMPIGYTNYQNGNVVVCPPDGEIRLARQVVINVQGRVRVNHRRNGEDIPVDRRGRKLRC